MQTKKCKHCEKELPIENFYHFNRKETSNTRIWSYCKDCERLRQKQKNINFKKQCLDYKQQFCCELCGYDKSVVALDFHHIDSSKKDFTISSSKTINLNKRIKNELDKCQVLCSNCHRELHSVENLGFIPKILKPPVSYLCIDCGKKTSNEKSRCLKCYHIYISKKSKCPSKKQLIEDFKELKYFTKVGLKYNVSDNAVRKWCKKYGMPDLNRRTLIGSQKS